MAYVKLPAHLRRRRVSGPNGRKSTLTFSVFAGETAESQDDDKGRTLVLKSPRRRQAFAFDSLPIDMQPGDIAGVAALMAPGRRTGPIIAVANVDRNEKADFVGREREILRLLTGQSRDYRRRGLALRRAGGGVISGAALGAGAFLALSLAPLFIGGPAPLMAAQLPAPVGVALGGVAMTHGALKGWFHARRIGRRQTRLLGEVWRGAADCLGFVQAHADVFRAPLSGSVASKPLLEAPRMRRSRRRPRRPVEPALTPALERVADQQRDPAFDPPAFDPMAGRPRTGRYGGLGAAPRPSMSESRRLRSSAEPGFSAS